MRKVNIPNDDQMWDLNEGFNFLQFNDQSGNFYKGTEEK